MVKIWLGLASHLNMMAERLTNVGRKKDRLTTRELHEIQGRFDHTDSVVHMKWSAVRLRTSSGPEMQEEKEKEGRSNYVLL